MARLRRKRRPGRFLDVLHSHLAGPGSEMVILDKPLRYRARDWRLFTVPADFICDLASVPKLFRSLATSWQQSARAGVLHDCAYRWYEVWGVERRDCDELYRQALRSDGVARWRARLQWLGVRIGGRGAWARWRALPDGLKGIEPPPVATAT